MSRRVRDRDPKRVRQCVRVRLKEVALRAIALICARVRITSLALPFYPSGQRGHIQDVLRKLHRFESDKWYSLLWCNGNTWAFEAPNRGSIPRWRIKRRNPINVTHGLPNAEEIQTSLETKKENEAYEEDGGQKKWRRTLLEWIQADSGKKGLLKRLMPKV